MKDLLFWQWRSSSSSRAERPDDGWRLFGDLAAIYRPSQRARGGIRGSRPRRPAGWPAARWNGVAAYVPYALDRRWALAFRAERFVDRDGAISGTTHTLSEGTATVEFRPEDRLILKLEGRYDLSTATVFGSRSGQRRGQPLAVLGAVATF